MLNIYAYQYVCVYIYITYIYSIYLYVYIYIYIYTNIYERILGGSAYLGIILRDIRDRLKIILEYC